jgi:hypothetical protein
MGGGRIDVFVWERDLAKCHTIIQQEGLEHSIEMSIYSPTII